MNSSLRVRRSQRNLPQLHQPRPRPQQPCPRPPRGEAALPVSAMYSRVPIASMTSRCEDDRERAQKSAASTALGMAWTAASGAGVMWSPARCTTLSAACTARAPSDASPLRRRSWDHDVGVSVGSESQWCADRERRRQSSSRVYARTALIARGHTVGYRVSLIGIEVLCKASSINEAWCRDRRQGHQRPYPGAGHGGCLSPGFGWV